MKEQDTLYVMVGDIEFELDEVIYAYEMVGIELTPQDIEILSREAYLK